MNIKEINKSINNNPYVTYLIRDKNMIRTQYTNEINF